jgi:hypothetical protein
MRIQPCVPSYTGVSSRCWDDLREEFQDSSSLGQCLDSPCLLPCGASHVHVLGSGSSAWGIGFDSVPRERLFYALPSFCSPPVENDKAATVTAPAASGQGVSTPSGFESFLRNLTQFDGSGLWWVNCFADRSKALWRLDDTDRVHTSLFYRVARESLLCAIDDAARNVLQCGCLLYCTGDAFDLEEVEA